MGEEIRLNDIADDLLILNKYTIDNLFQLDNCSDCIALYVFYYKIAKWQKTNTIKANDLYVKKSLKWGIDKIKRTKKTLKEHGLIKIVQRRKDNKITGWYVEVSYLVAQKKTDDIKVKVEESNNTRNQQYLNPTSSCEETNALKEKIKCLEKEIKILKDIINSPAKAEPTTAIVKEIIDYMNNCGELESFKVKKTFNFSPKAQGNLKYIIPRLKEGNTLDDFKDVIYHCYEKFIEKEFTGLNGKSSIQYYRPSTIFSGENMEKYKNEYRNL